MAEFNRIDKLAGPGLTTHKRRLATRSKSYLGFALWDWRPWSTLTRIAQRQSSALLCASWSWLRLRCFFGSAGAEQNQIWRVFSWAQKE